MKQLDSFYPEANRIICEETVKEANFRRQAIQDRNRRTFVIHVIGQVCALLIALAAIVGGCYIAIENPDHAYVGAAIAISAVSGLAIAFISERRRSA